VRPVELLGLVALLVATIALVAAGTVAWYWATGP
jgi:hypothetical protein